MKVSRVELVERTNFLNRKNTLLYTFFELTASEQKKYDDFREKHNNLARFINKSEGKGLGTKERGDGEKEVEEIFLELINPYLKEQGLQSRNAFTYYGKPRKTCLKLPKYVLFEDNKPFNSAIVFDYWFLTEDENLSCKSGFHHSNTKEFSSEYDARQDTLIYKLFEKIVANEKQDGINFPILSFESSFIYFASANFAYPMMSLVKNILEKTGPESMKELNIIYGEYIRQVRGEDTKIQQKIFKEAYENKLEEIVKTYELLEVANSLIHS